MRNKLIYSALILVICTGIAFAQAAPDPMRIATGARTLGMGKAFAGLADDVGSIFMNPSGLANADKWQITSMSGKFLDEFNYLSLSGVYPTNYGKFGLAFIGGAIGGALPTKVKEGSDPTDPIYEVDSTTDQMSYYNNVFILTYADKMKKLMELDNPYIKMAADRAPWLKDVNVGANLKLFRSGLAGDHISQGSASGMDMDFSMQAKPMSWFSFGANLQNALPSALGGKLTYSSGWTESFPAILKTGLAFNVLGDADAFRQWNNQNVKLLLDSDWEPTRSQYVPILFHLGAEWMPLDLISIRAGIDQEQVGAGTTANNLAAGVGVLFRGFRFDYAYHQFAGAPGIDNHFFSLSYGTFGEKQKAVLAHRVTVQPDKLITYEASTPISGKLMDFDIATIKINGAKIRINKGLTFEVQAPLELAKNSFKVESFDTKGASIEVDKARILRLATYPDVARNYWSFEQVGYIGTLGLIKGYPDGKFKPEGNITRAELAALLVRTMVGGDDKVPVASKEAFKDVKLKHWAIKYVNLAVAKAVVKGYPDKTFRPSANITRAEGLMMIARFGGVKETPYTGTEFKDVNAKHWAATIIAGSFKEGLLNYFKGKPFEANKKLTRAEAVEMLYRSQPVVRLVNDLNDFEKGY